MTFEVSAQAYVRFMGRYSSPLATSFADLADVRSGQDALDVGCGTGALTDVLVERLGADRVTAVDPSQSFVAALSAKHPDLPVQRASAERLPFADATFDRTLAQLVVHFMAEPAKGLAEMARVTRPGGIVAANVWADAGSPLALFWRAARELDPACRDESGRPGVSEGQLAALFTAAGMPGARSAGLSVQVDHPTFEEWWEPYTFGVGPVGQHVERLAPHDRAELRERCRSLLPAAPVTVDAQAWTVWWVKPDRMVPS